MQIHLKRKKTKFENKTLTEQIQFFFWMESEKLIEKRPG